MLNAAHEVIKDPNNEAPKKKLAKNVGDARTAVVAASDAIRHAPPPVFAVTSDVRKTKWGGEETERKERDIKTIGVLLKQIHTSSKSHYVFLRMFLLGRRAHYACSCAYRSRGSRARQPRGRGRAATPRGRIGKARKAARELPG